MGHEVKAMIELRKVQFPYHEKLVIGKGISNHTDHCFAPGERGHDIATRCGLRMYLLKSGDVLCEWFEPDSLSRRERVIIPHHRVLVMYPKDSNDFANFETEVKRGPGRPKKIQ